jgi:hypothetical protein
LKGKGDYSVNNNNCDVKVKKMQLYNGDTRNNVVMQIQQWLQELKNVTNMVLHSY